MTKRKNLSRRSLGHPSRLHALWVIFLIYAFPPYAWHNMWVHKKYHSWFAYVAWVNAAWLFLPLVVYLVVTYPKLAASSKNPLLPLTIVYPLLAFSLSQIFYGSFLRKKTDSIKGLPRNLLLLTVVIFFIDYMLTLLITPLAVPLLNNPIYDVLVTFTK